MDLLKKIKAKEWIIFIGVLFLFLTIDYFMVYVYYMSGSDLYDLTMADKIIILFAKYIILIILFFVRDFKYLKEKWFDFIKNFKNYFEIGLKYWITGLIIMFVSNILINYFVPGLGENESSVQSLISKVPLLAFLLTTILAPFVEEMIFRKYLRDCVDKKILYMILSGLIFGFIHTSIDTNILELLLIIPYGALGFMFAKTIVETDNIYTTVLMHMLHNGILTLIAIWGLL